MNKYQHIWDEVTKLLIEARGFLDIKDSKFVEYLKYVDDDFNVTASNFNAAPGSPILHPKELVKLIGFDLRNEIHSTRYGTCDLICLELL